MFQAQKFNLKAKNCPVLIKYPYECSMQVNKLCIFTFKNEFKENKLETINKPTISHSEQQKRKRTNNINAWD